MRAKSIKGKSPEEIELALKESTSDGFKPTLAIVFLSIKQNMKAVSKIFDDAGLSVYGATTHGEFIDENFEQGTIVVLLLDINRDYFFIQFAELNGKEDREIARDLANKALKRFERPAFIVTGNNLQTDIEELLSGFIDVIGNGANIVGGMAGDDISFTTQYVFANGKFSDRGVIVLAVDEDKIIVKGKAKHGWKAVGTAKTVTRSEGNRVYTIDNVAALDICLKYSGVSADKDNLLYELVTNFPLQLQRDNGGPLMRPAYHINWEDHSMLTSGKLPEGSTVRFSIPPDFDVIEEVIEENKKMKETELSDPDALIIYNCGGRLMSFGPLIGEEIKGIKNVWNVPMVGMFSNAEIGRTTNGNVEMHNLTTCWVLLKEK